jgi:hypothetical protein
VDVSTPLPVIIGFSTTRPVRQPKDITNWFNFLWKREKRDNIVIPLILHCLLGYRQGKSSRQLSASVIVD